MKDPEISQYLSRLKLDDCDPTFAGLTDLQEHHMENIPFENLDIIVGRTIALDYQHLFEKVITKKRGGYCFELNTLYGELLRSLGFAPKAVLGRVWLSNPKRTPPRNHLAHILDLDGKTYVTDVGFGGLMTRIPLDINISSPVSDKDGLVRVVQFADHQYMIQRQIESEWTNQYSFEDMVISKEDIFISNYYMSTHPKSHFFHHRFVGRNTKDGRIGLFNQKMSFRKGIKIVEKNKVNFGKDWLLTLKNYFSIVLDFSEKEIDILFGKILK